jgi:hypothetical protein
LDRRGELLLTADGTTATADTGTTPADHHAWMWDLTVDTLHAFYAFAGKTPVLVHNCTLTIPQRLSILYERLGALPAQTTADEALDQLNSTLTSVEDEYSGVVVSPNPGLKFDGRMYPPRADFIEREADGTITATTKGNIIEISPDGSMTILTRSGGEVVYS